MEIGWSDAGRTLPVVSGASGARARFASAAVFVPCVVLTNSHPSALHPGGADSPPGFRASPHNSTASIPGKLAGTRGRTLTCNLRIRSAALYTFELREQLKWLLSPRKAEMERAPGLAPGKSGFANRRLDDCGIARVLVFRKGGETDGCYPRAAIFTGSNAIVTSRSPLKWLAPLLGIAPSSHRLTGGPHTLCVERIFGAPGRSCTCVDPIRRRMPVVCSATGAWLKKLVARLGAAPSVSSSQARRIAVFLAREWLVG